jgi:hypothetical protein
MSIEGRQVAAKGVTLNVLDDGDGQRCCCCTASRTRAICGATRSPH